MNRFNRVCRLIVCVLFAGAVGCASSGRAGESEQAVQSMNDTRAQLEKAKKEVTDTTASLDALSSGADIQKAFSTYTKDVSDVKAAGDKARDRWESMEKNRKAYIEKWQSEAATIENPQIKASMEQRKQQVVENYGKIKATAQSVRDAYQPFLKQLQSIQKALSLDLSQSGVNALKGEMGTAKSMGQTLNQKIDALIAQLDEVSGGMAPPTPPESKS